MLMHHAYCSSGPTPPPAMPAPHAYCCTIHHGGMLNRQHV
jgi:hypothetical protein